ncbi:unnamed protein product [Miscanthus lutarioriparius]|uniref:Uncharacterized protein n=1 Tax=Miscanthus lutarioriparius TaxID=422564 RepID=A0A811QXS7_9POAL|nr:unnamed protein product [Miscanthus lutarioriparius]
MADEEEEIVLPENQILTIYGGTATPASKTKLKQVQRQVTSTQSSERRLKWSEVPILFDLRDHPLNLYDGPLLLLVIQPYIGNYKAATIPTPIVAAPVVVKPSIPEVESSKAVEARSKAPILP